MAESIPSSADIVIIGGGVQGAALAFHLARADAARVVVLEKRHLAAGPTGQSGAMIRALFTERAYVRLVTDATRMFEQWGDLVGGTAGFVQNGFLRITDSLEPEAIGADLKLLDECNEPYEVVRGERLERLAPTGEFNDSELGLFLPRGGFADPVLTTIELGAAARRLGAEIIEGAQVTSIETAGGRVRAVVTDQGRIETPIVVNCAGTWSRRVAEMVGVDLPIEVHRTPTGMFRWPEAMRVNGPILSDGINRIYLRAHGDCLLRAAHFGWTVDPADPDGFDETVNGDQINTLRSAMHKRYAAMRRTVYTGGFSALYDMTPDGHPIVGPIAEVEGFWCSCGWSGNGFAGAPAVGECLSRMILRRPGEVDFSPFAWPRTGQHAPRPDRKWVHR